MKTAFIIFSLITVITNCTPKNQSKSGADVNCPEVKGKNFKFRENLSLASGGSLGICGQREEDGKFFGDIYFRHGGEPKRVISVGGQTDLTGLLGMSYVFYKPNSSGLEIIKLVPFKKNFVPTLSYNLECSKMGCIKQNAASCRFEQQKGDVDKSVLNTFSKFVRHQGAFPSHEDVYALFDNALMGDVESIKFITSQVLKERFHAQGPNSQAQSSTFAELQRVYNQLIENKCVKNY